MIIIALLVRGYAAIGLIIFSNGFRKFITDKNTPNTHKSSWIVLGIATVFWPIVLPLSHLERQANQKIDSDQFDQVEFRLSAPPLVERNKSKENQSNSGLTSENISLKDSNIA